MRTTIGIAPSILSADFSRLREEIHAVESEAEAIHVDVMDGHFVPNLTVGPPVVAALRKVTSLPLDCHLMVNSPENYVEAFASAGADIVTVHAEATYHLQRLLSRIRELGKRAGVALCPHTSEEVLRYVIRDLDLVLVMCVNPGFGGQVFLPAMLEKVASVRRIIDESGCPIRLEVDGGINRESTEAVVRAGADLLVAGAAIYGAPDRCAATAAIRDVALRGLRS
jgi:ribulose-phosphate 3-epimerase